MVYIERVENPYSEFYLSSFSCILEEEEFKDALKYEKDAVSQILKNKTIEAFRYHPYAFATYLIKNEETAWLGYIQLYNDLFVKKQLEKFKKIAMPKLKKIAEFPPAREYYQTLLSEDCASFHMQQVMQILMENYLQYGGLKKELDDFYVNCQTLLEERPANLLIEFAVYERLSIFPEDINNLLEELKQKIKQTEYKNCNILLKCTKNDIVLDFGTSKIEKKQDFTYIYLEQPQEKEDLKMTLKKGI